MPESEDGPVDRTSYLTLVKSTLLHPVHVLLSPALLRTYLHTVLLALTSLSLFAVAVVAYTWFYYAYIPASGINVDAYLQFQHSTPAPASIPSYDSELNAQRGNFPYAVARIGRNGKQGLVSRQKYDVLVELDLPRSDRNLRAGNWMVGLELRGPGGLGDKVGRALGLEWQEEFEEFSWGENAGRERRGSGSGATTEEEKLAQARILDDKRDEGVVLARSRRPAILTYRSAITELAYRLLRLPLYVLGWGHEAEKVEVAMMEGVEFEKGWRNVPSLLRLEVRSQSVLEVYRVRVKFVAKLGGLRYLMYTHRILSFLAFTTLFWAVETTLLLLTWGAITFVFSHSSPPSGNQGQIEPHALKREPSSPSTPKFEATPTASPSTSHPTTPLSPPSFSDSSRTFPTLHSHAPLHYSHSQSEPKIKRESKTPNLEDVPLSVWARGSKTEDADDEDEDEDADFVLDEPGGGRLGERDRDSGIGSSTGTSGVEKRERGGLVRRRSSGG